MKFAAPIFLLVAAMALNPLGSAVAQNRITMRISHVGPEAHAATQTLRKVAERINARPGANLKVEVFPGGALGGDVETANQVARGVIEATLAGGGSILAGFDPKFGIEELPFLFPSREAAYKAMDGKLGDAMAQLAEKHGFKILAYWENGFRHFTNSKRSIKTPADMSGLRFRSAEVAVRLEMFKQLKASAVPMPFPELYQALQQGVVDGQENPVAIIYAASMFNVQKYLSLSGHIWNSMPVVVSKKWYDSLSNEAKAILKEEFLRGQAEERAAIEKAETQQIGLLKEKGMTVNEVDGKAFRAAADSVWKVYENTFGSELMRLAREIRDSSGR